MSRSDNGRNGRSSRGNYTSVLVVSSFPDDAVQVREMLDKLLWNVLSAGTLRQAQGLLDDHPITIVICERDLPDGCWRDLLYAPSPVEEAPLLIVTSRLADERLWTEVLHEGGFDVIPKPLCRREVTLVLASASRQNQRQHQQVRRAEA